MDFWKMETLEDITAYFKDLVDNLETYIDVNHAIYDVLCYNSNADEDLIRKAYDDVNRDGDLDIKKNPNNPTHWR